MPRMTAARVAAIVLPAIPNDNGRDLIPNALVAVMPPMDAQDGKGRNARAFIKVFNPNGKLTIFITEASPIDARGRILPNDSDPATWANVKMFSWSSGSDQLSCIFRSDLINMRSAPIDLGGLGKLPPIPFERDTAFEPKSLCDAIEEQARYHGVSVAEFCGNYGVDEMGEDDCGFIPADKLPDEDPLFGRIPAFLR